MVDAGWYNDPSDPAVARWHDGAGWTEHTVVKADWAGRGAPPPPVPQPEPTAWIPAAAPPPPSSSSLPPPPPLGVAPVVAKASVAERYRGWPRWARIATPIAAVIVVLTAIGAAAGEDDSGKVDTAGATSTTTDHEDTSTTAGTKSLRRAADEAADGLGFEVPSASMEHVILSMCDGSVAASSDAIEAITREPEQEYQTLQAGLAAARQACPDRMSSFPYLGGDVLAELGARKDAATSTTAAPVTTAAPAPVVKAPVTTRAPATTQAPVATQPPAQPPSSCDPNYSGCLDPSSPDYDCAGGSGNGPDYTGTVQVLGNDHYGLDADHDGVGCE